MKIVRDAWEGALCCTSMQHLCHKQDCVTCDSDNQHTAEACSQSPSTWTPGQSCIVRLLLRHRDCTLYSVRILAGRISAAASHTQNIAHGAGDRPSHAAAVVAALAGYCLKGSWRGCDCARGASGVTRTRWLQFTGSSKHIWRTLVGSMCHRALWRWNKIISWSDNAAIVTHRSCPSGASTAAMSAAAPTTRSACQMACNLCKLLLNMCPQHVR